MKTALIAVIVILLAIAGIAKWFPDLGTDDAHSKSVLFWVQVIGTITLVVTLFFSAVQLSHSSQSIAATHQPHLAVRGITLKAPGDESSLWVFNEGSGNAHYRRGRLFRFLQKHALWSWLIKATPFWKARRLERACVTVFIGSEPLPKPNLIGNALIAKKLCQIPLPHFMPPGGWYHHKFDIREVVLEEHLATVERLLTAGSFAGVDIFVVGLIRYGSDWKHAVHRTLFCRRYAPGKDNFVAIDDDHYEYSVSPKVG